ncbi:MAG: hypothetical protein PW844_17265 [Pantoea sp.]|uniref:hypothetical protein n=1 Tax=Pantoea sp. TaxID=69393 RepID=UPI00239134A0|nr:hypothetical protein [Pantoea sp.]MDE1188216.1 hypothetical protein [Pantoea sp.]
MNKLARILLTASSIAPVSITLIFIGFMKCKPWLIWSSFAVCLVSFISVVFFLRYASQNITPLFKNISSISPANKEVTNYFLSYLFPLLGTDSIADKWQYALFFYASLLIYVSFSENYNFNPLISILGYKFYEAEDDTGVGFVLISKKVITDVQGKDFEVIQLTDYTFIHVIRN